MSWGEPQVEIYCDAKGCKESDFFYLTCTARGYDERNIKDDARAYGWIITDEGDFCCPECAGIKEETTDETR